MDEFPSASCQGEVPCQCQPELTPTPLANFFFAKHVIKRHTGVASWIFSPELIDQDPKSNYLKVIKLIRYYLPPFVKHVLAPQNDFGMPNITVKSQKFWD